MRFASSSIGVLFHCEVTRSSSSKFYFENIHISYTALALAKKKDGKKIIFKNAFIEGQLAHRYVFQDDG